MTDETRSPLGRESMHLKDTMLRHHGNIESLLFAAEIACHEASENEYRCPLGPDCPFRRTGECGLPRMREIIGDHV